MILKFYYLFYYFAETKKRMIKLIKEYQRISVAGIVIGIGLGGLIDSFLFHMILQWHHLLSNIIPPNSIENLNQLMIGDGLFDAFCFIVILIGVLLLQKDYFYYQNLIHYYANNSNVNFNISHLMLQKKFKVVPSTVAFCGQLIFGWGVFNTIEGIVDHHILELHYVRDVPEFAIYNWSFLIVFGFGLLFVGFYLMKKNKSNLL